MKQLQELARDLVGLLSGKGATDELGNALSYVGVESSATATPANVTAAVSSTTLLAANSARKGVSIYNDSTAILYLLLGAGPASTTVYTTQVGPQALWEMPVPPVFTGQLTGIWAAANGAARVTELS